MKYLLVLPILLLWSCSQGNPEKEKDDKAQDQKPVIQKKVVGRIASVSSTGSFVLIQKYGTGSLPKEAVFQSQGNEGRQASLRPSGERVRDFFAADLLSGSAKIGDAVLAYHTPGKEEPVIEEDVPGTPAEDVDIQEKNENPEE